MRSDQPGVAAAAATGIEHQPAGQVAGCDARLDEEGRFVFLRPDDVISVPLAAETGGVGVELPAIRAMPSTTASSCCSGGMQPISAARPRSRDRPIGKPGTGEGSVIQGS